MIWRVEISDKPGVFDAVGEAVKKDIEDLGIYNVRDVRFAQLYFITGKISQEQITVIARELLVDSITQTFRVTNSKTFRKNLSNKKNARIVEVAYNPGVMDPVEESTLKGIRDLGIHTAEGVRTSRLYHIDGKLNQREFTTICEKLLCNKVIQHIVGNPTDSFKALAESSSHGYRFHLLNVEILNANDTRLLEISKKGQLFLNLREMQQIKEYFTRLGRNPTDCELETIAQTWSEHCAHKTFRGKIEYSCNGTKKVINNLLKSTIMKVTKKLNKPWCVSVFKDNSGIIRFDKDYDVCFKVETHNHPSALEPFGGANTGIGGVIRDPLGTGLSAKPILNTDVFCFGKPDYSFNRLPKGTLHPKRVMKGVVSGVRDYGNKMGIPTVNGAILFDNRYVGNPLVYCGTVGIMPKGKAFKKVSPGDLILLVGGKTGRDGIHGATFSSGELTHESEDVSSSAVQIGNPIQEKKMVDTILKARERKLFSAITDCGAGGLSSAVGEMGEHIGARVDLEKVPLKYKGLSYYEIWISEAQERMVLAVPQKHKEQILEIFTRENVEATIIGEFTNTKRLKLFYQGNSVCDLDMRFLHNGLPQISKKAIWKKKRLPEPKFAEPKDLTVPLKKILSNWDVCSKEWVIRQYDHEVQGGSIIKPLVGVQNDGPSDASVTKPRFDSKKGIIISNGINFRFGDIDPYWMAATCIDEALRQIIAVGGNLKQVALLDNFCWGNPDKPDRLGSMVRASEGCYKIALGYGTPFISGKDSLNNEYSEHGKSMAIPGTLLISAIGVMDDVSKAITMDVKCPGNLIYVVGLTLDELGGSQYYHLRSSIGNNVPQVNVTLGKKIMDTLSKVTNLGLVASCHDCSEGGIAVAAAEMAFSGGLGMDIFVSEIPYKGKKIRNDVILFSESNSRFLVEVSPKHKNKFEQLLKSLPLGLIGCISDSKEFRAYGMNGKTCIKAPLDELKESWQTPLKW
ncbi:phosphoribosylformylglycinamidine synthase subunit PurL [Candidatus Omnitrophota bacterium]